jgi:ectoine hydroxylase-related dioxygenase (phytanoyl-CoA dioxygenase family)
MIDAEAFRRDGAVCIRGLASAGAIERLAKAIDGHLATLGPLAVVASSNADPGRFVEDFCNWPRISEYERFARRSRAAEVAARLMGSRTARLYHDHLLVKEARTVQRTPWHQDQPYYDVDGSHVVSMWLPVDPIPRVSTLELIAGSHREGWLLPRTFKEKAAKWFPEGTLADVPDVEADRAAFPIIGWELEPGDAVFFHALTVHGSAGSIGRRRVLSLRFLGDDARFAPRPWRTSPPTHPDVARDLEPGAPMVHAQFPLLYSS